MPAENQQATTLGLPPFARELIAAGIGLSAGLIAIFWQPELTQRGAIQSAALLGVLCLLAGFVAANLVRWNEVGREKAVAVAFHIGVRVGLFAAVLATAAFVALATLHAWLASTRAEEAALKLLAWRSLLAGVTSIIPGAAVGCIGAGLAVMFRLSSIPNLLPPRSGDIDADTAATAWQRQIQLARLLSVLSVLGIMSPTILLFKAPVVDPPVVKVVPVPPPPPPPPPPPWRYEQPPGLATASPLNFSIAAHRSVPACVPGAPLSISPNGRWLAFCPAEAPSVAIMDLDFATVIRIYGLEAIPTALSWSPDSRRVLVQNQPADGGDRLTVVFAEEDKALVLPRPKNRDLPRGPVYWARETEAVFFPDDEPFLSFDLDQLRLHPLTESKTFAPPDEWNPEKQFRLPASSSWQFHVSAATLSVQLAPRRQPEAEPEILRRNCLAVGGPNLTVSRSFPQIPLSDGIAIALAKDGSKVVHIEEGNAEIIYFRLRSSQHAQFTISMPAPQEDAAKEQTVAQALASFALCAMVYSPMRNPLTETIIGPDRERPLGLLRFASWKGETASLWLAEMSGHVSSGDVVADVHQWMDGEFVASPLLPDPFWWAPLGAGTTESNSPPDAKPLETTANLTVSRREDSIIAFGPPGEQPSRRLGMDAPPTGLEPPDSDADESRIREFVLAHHDKASNGDIVGLGRNYADEVEFLGKRKSRADIVAETRAYHAKWRIVSESIHDPITVKRIGAEYQATYTVRFRTESNDGEWSEGNNYLTLTLRIVNEKIEIVRQSARVYDRRSSQADAPPRVTPPPNEPNAPPPIRMVLSGPVWAYRHSSPVDGNRTVLLDVVKLLNHGFEYQKTFRTVSPAGRVTHQQTAIIKGNVRREGDMISLYFAELGWRREDAIGSPDRQIMRMLESKVGQFLRFRIQGENLVCVDFPGTFTPKNG